MAPPGVRFPPSLLAYAAGDAVGQAARAGASRRAQAGSATPRMIRSGQGRGQGSPGPDTAPVCRLTRELNPQVDP